MLTSYQEITSRYPNHTPRPVIGISGNFGDNGLELAEGYYRSIIAAGGIAVALPPIEDAEQILGQLESVDGILLSGGGDINPLLLNEEPLPQLGRVNPVRDSHELLLAKLAYDRGIPMLGICRGIQVLVAALGGTLHQDIKTCLPDANILKHSQQMPRFVASHTVSAVADSIIGKTLGTSFAVNSFHHQAVATPGPLLRITATAPDGVIEAVESTDFKSVMGVQWHPECFILDNNPCMLPLFRHFVGEANSFRKAKSLHQRILTIDSHCDTAMQFDKGVDFQRRDPNLLVDAHKMTEGMLDAACMVAYLEQQGRSESELQAATDKAVGIINRLKAMVGATEGFSIALTKEDLLQNKFEGKKSVVLGIENGYALGKDLKNIRKFWDMGVRYLTLCHNGDNDLCDSARKSTQEHGGLSDFGRAAVEELNRTGMLIDLSHAAESTFYEVLERSQRPVACTHSSARTLCNHPRNLTDDQLRALAQQGGVAQATFYAGFLRENEGATVDDAVRHILHMINIAGIDHVGIGSDFDGDGGVPGLASAADMVHLTRRLQAEGLSDEDLRKLWGANFLRVLFPGN